MIQRVRLESFRFRTSSVEKRVFIPEYDQKGGNFIQQARTTKEIRGKIKSVFKKRTGQDAKYNENSSNSKKGYTPSPNDECDYYPFNISFFCNASVQK